MSLWNRANHRGVETYAVIVILDRTHGRISTASEGREKGGGGGKQIGQNVPDSLSYSKPSNCYIWQITLQGLWPGSNARVVLVWSKQIPDPYRFINLFSITYQLLSLQRHALHRFFSQRDDADHEKPRFSRVLMITSLQMKTQRKKTPPLLFVLFVVEHLRSLKTFCLTITTWKSVSWHYATFPIVPCKCFKNSRGFSDMKEVEARSKIEK